MKRASSSRARRRSGAWPLAARAQQPAIPVVGFLSSASPDQDAGRLRGFRQGLSEAGFVEGRNVSIEYRWAEEQIDRLPALVADLVRREVAVIVQAGRSSGRLLPKPQPKPFRSSFSPAVIRWRWARRQPGPTRRQCYGHNHAGRGVGAEAPGTAARGGRPERPPWAPSSIRPIPTPSLNRRIFKLQRGRWDLASTSSMPAARTISTQPSPDCQLQAAVCDRNDGLSSAAASLAAPAVQHAVPAIFQFRPFAAAGGLMSYGGNLVEMYRQSGIYTARILRGEKPADLPVQQVTRVELIINLEVARRCSVLRCRCRSSDEPTR